MKIKLDRSRVEITKDGITYRVGKYYTMVSDSAGSSMCKLTSISWDAFQKAYFLCLDNGHSINIAFAEHFLEEVTMDYIVCENCGHLNARQPCR